MKILFRSLLILFVFSLAAGAMIVSVNGAAALGESAGILDKEEPEQFSPPQDSNGGDENAPAREGERDERDFLSLLRDWIFGIGKDVFVVSFFVVCIVLPRSLFRRIKRTLQA